MSTYTIKVNATSNVAANTKDAFVDLDAPVGQAFKLTRVKLSVRTPASDARVIAQILRKSAVGAGGVAGTEVEKDPLGPPPLVVATIKSGATAVAVGTVVDTVDEFSMNGRAIYEWVPRTDAEKITSTSGEIIGINLEADVVSLLIDVTVEWEE